VRVPKAGVARARHSILEVAPKRPPVRTSELIEAALRELTEGRDDWPPQRSVAAAGLGALYASIQKRNKRLLWARRLGLKINHGRHVGTSKWSESQIEAALRAFTAGRSSFPRRGEFDAAGQYNLYVAFRKSGPRAWTVGRRLGLPRDTPWWTDRRIERELRDFLKGRSTWPTRANFERAGKVNPYPAAGRHGGISRLHDRSAAIYSS
jgi:hypothetical protein